MTDGETFLYLTTIGHKSGTPHEIEIWFVEHDGRYYLVSEHRERSHWVQNIRKTPDVMFRIGSRQTVQARFRGTGRVVDADREPDITAAVARLMDEKYQWSEGLIVELTPE